MAKLEALLVGEVARRMDTTAAETIGLEQLQGRQDALLELTDLLLRKIQGASVPIGQDSRRADARLDAFTEVLHWAEVAAGELRIEMELWRRRR